MKSDIIVAARIPKEVKEQGNAILADLGLTPTQFINSAYNYILEFKKLPFDSIDQKPGNRVIDKVRLQEISDELSSLQVSTFDYSQGGTRSLKDVLAEKLQDKHGIRP